MGWVIFLGGQPLPFQRDRVPVLHFWGTSSYAQSIWSWTRKLGVVIHGEGACLNEVRRDPSPKEQGPRIPHRFWGTLYICLHVMTNSNRILHVDQITWEENVYRLDITPDLGGKSLSLRFNGHFPDEPGLAGVYWSKGWWKWWWQLDYWSYKSCKAPVKSSPATNQQPDAGCPSCRPTNSVKALKGKISHSMDLLTPSSPGDLPTLSLTLAENICEKCWRVICLW